MGLRRQQPRRPMALTKLRPDDPYDGGKSRLLTLDDLDRRTKAAQRAFICPTAWSPNVAAPRA